MSKSKTFDGWPDYRFTKHMSSDFEFKQRSQRGSTYNFRPDTPELRDPLPGSLIGQMLDPSKPPEHWSRARKTAFKSFFDKERQIAGKTRCTYYEGHPLYPKGLSPG